MAERHLEHDWFDRPLPDNVIVGERSWLYSSYAFLHYRSRQRPGLAVGRDSGIYDGTFFDLGPEGQVLIGDYCSIVGAIFATDRLIVVGDYAFVAHEVVIADSFAATPPAAIESNDAAGPERCSDAREATVLIENNAWVGARATLLAGARIGEGAVVGACTVVDFAVPAYAVVAGNPARIVGSAR